VDEQRHGVSPLPTFTIVVPTRDRPRQLSACLQGIARLTYPRDRFDVVVVNDGGEPPDAQIAAKRPVLRVTLVSQPNAGPGVARNTGVAHASGDYIAFLGDDCEPGDDWLQVLAARFAHIPDCLLGGRIVNALPQNPCSAASDHLIGYLYAHYNRDPQQAHFFTPNNMAVPRSLFTALGGFDPSMGSTGEDRELCDRWRDRGHRIIYAQEAVVYHRHPLTLAGFWRQQVGYGRGSRRYRRMQRQPREGTIAPERLSFYIDLVRFPFARERGWRAWLGAALLGLSQIANAAGFLLEAVRERSRLMRGHR